MTINPYREYSLDQKQAVITELVSLLRAFPADSTLFSEFLRRLEMITPTDQETRALLGDREKRWLEEIYAENLELRGTQAMDRVRQLIVCPMPLYQSSWGT